METISLIRTETSLFQTMGYLFEFPAKTLELGWHNNQSNISCIPLGEYLCKYTRSNRMSKKMGKQAIYWARDDSGSDNIFILEAELDLPEVKTVSATVERVK